MEKTTLSVFAVLLFLAVLVSASWLRAEDDDDDEHEEHHAERSERLMRFRGLAPLKETAGSAAFKKECASCHMAYPPGLLPARSWTKLMSGLKDHFGEDASLDAKTADAIKEYLVKNSADQAEAGRFSAKIDASIPASQTPIRITETAYFKRKHHELNPAVFKRKSIGSPGNCVACHQGADKGSFNEHSVRIPKW